MRRVHDRGGWPDAGPIDRSEHEYTMWEKRTDALMRLLTGHDGHGVAESLFHGTRPREGKVVEALGAEVVEVVNDKIKEIRDYHRPAPAKAA